MKAILPDSHPVLGATLIASFALACPAQEHPRGGAPHPHEDATGREKRPQKSEDHNHEEGTASITRWTERLELFAQHPPAVAGQPLPFLAHLTLLDGFEPLMEATVTLSLNGPGDAEGRATERVGPGIFRPTLTAPAAGTYRARLTVHGPEVMDTIEGFEIVVHPTTIAAAKAVHPKAIGEEPISFLKEQQWQIPFATTFAHRDTIVPTLEVAGEVTTPPSGQAEVGAATSGRIVAPKSGLPRPGQTVRRDQLLARIAPAPAAPEDAARAELAVIEAEARVQAARARVERARRLIRDRAIPMREVEEAERELRVAEQAVLAAQRARAVFIDAARGRGGGTWRVSAPIDGVVVQVEATEGRSVEAGELLFRVVDLDELWIRARVPEQQAALLATHYDGAFALPGVDGWQRLDVSGHDASASVVTVGRVVDPRSRTVDVIYALHAPDTRLRVGAMTRVAVPVGEAWRGVVIPRSAVLDDDGRSIVYVQVEGEAFEERTARLGPRSGDLIGVERGVRAGERVVTLGAHVIRLASRAGSGPAHGHVH